ncbi:hypothetical protein ASC87_15145 [Rhizobacter sp. Root1221]|nr:hypothetical protein ASC87_15145 [Rhizobacter sp. Root1221]
MAGRIITRPWHPPARAKRQIGVCSQRRSLCDANLKSAQFGGADLRSVDLGKGAIMSTDQAAMLIGGLGVRVV